VTFNVTLNVHDRNNPGDHWRNTQRFAEIVNTMGLHDLRLQGRRYTWSSTRDEPRFAGLDQFLLSTAMTRLFPNATQVALPNTSSDNCPLLAMFQADHSFPTYF
jgi:hypothetical protein